MKQVVSAIQQLDPQDIQSIEEKGILTIGINGKSITLERNDVEISSQDIEGWLVANHGPLTVALDVTINAPLKEEGIARELVNRIQNLRKDSGFEVTDTIDVYLLHNDNMHSAIQNNLEYIKQETLTHTLQEINQLDKGIEIEFDNISTKLFIQQHL
jgi:isoleucyl-tRNA synthetase